MATSAALQRTTAEQRTESQPTTVRCNLPRAALKVCVGKIHHVVSWIGVLGAGVAQLREVWHHLRCRAAVEDRSSRHEHDLCRQQSVSCWVCWVGWVCCPRSCQTLGVRSLTLSSCWNTCEEGWWMVATTV